jgi:hypothetical protein
VPAAITDQLARRARGASGAYSPETKCAYRQDSASFLRFCQGVGVQSLPATPEFVVDYVQAQAAVGLPQATIRQRVATVAKMD